MDSRRGKHVLTIGHSTRSSEEFLEILKAFHVTRLVDIRTVPRSRTNPQFNPDELAVFLEDNDIAWQHMSDLGGLRKPKKDSINSAWRNDSFRGYADYMQTPEFESAINELIALTEKDTVAIMCAEAVPWRCHRSMVADALVARGFKVDNIMSKTKADPHKLRPFAQVTDQKLVYYPG